jgi:hypothetical protein
MLLAEENIGYSSGWVEATVKSSHLKTPGGDKRDIAWEQPQPTLTPWPRGNIKQKPRGVLIG